jgi:transcriptional regulator with XRE-family HTH domain
MSIDKIKQKLIQNSIKDSGWLAKAQWREDNEDWLDISFSIAVRIGATLNANKKANVHPKTQVELAEAMGCSAQYVNKLLRGEENLQIETISKIQRILGITLIEVPKIMESKQTLHYNPVNSLIGKINIISPAIHSSKSYVKVKIEMKAAGEGNYALAA